MTAAETSLGKVEGTEGGTVTGMDDMHRQDLGAVHMRIDCRGGDSAATPGTYTVNAGIALGALPGRQVAAAHSGARRRG